MPKDAIRTWNECKEALIQRSFSSRTWHFKNILSSFKERPFDSFYEALERLKGHMWACLHFLKCPFYLLYTGAFYHIFRLRGQSPKLWQPKRSILKPIFKGAHTWSVNHIKNWATCSNSTTDLTFQGNTTCLWSRLETSVSKEGVPCRAFSVSRTPYQNYVCDLFFLLQDKINRISSHLQQNLHPRRITRKTQNIWPRQSSKTILWCL